MDTFSRELWPFEKWIFSTSLYILRFSNGHNSLNKLDRHLQLKHDTMLISILVLLIRDYLPVNSNSNYSIIKTPQWRSPLHKCRLFLLSVILRYGKFLCSPKYFVLFRVVLHYFLLVQMGCGCFCGNSQLLSFLSFAKQKIFTNGQWIICTGN